MPAAQHSTYIQRRRAISEILDPYLDVASMVPTNLASAFEPDFFENSLWCTWADPGGSAQRAVSVFVHRVSDGQQEAAGVREMMTTEARSGEPSDPDADAYELPGSTPGEFVFVLHYLSTVTVVSGHCVVSLMPSGAPMPLDELTRPALDIARTVGCSPYVDDFEPSRIDERKMTGRWSTADGVIYDPRTPPQP